MTNSTDYLWIISHIFLQHINVCRPCSTLVDDYRFISIRVIVDDTVSHHLTEHIRFRKCLCLLSLKYIICIIHNLKYRRQCARMYLRILIQYCSQKCGPRTRESTIKIKFHVLSGINRFVNVPQPCCFCCIIIISHIVCGFCCCNCIRSSSYTISGGTAS